MRAETRRSIADHESVLLTLRDSAAAHTRRTARGIICAKVLKNKVMHVFGTAKLVTTAKAMFASNAARERNKVMRTARHSELICNAEHVFAGAIPSDADAAVHREQSHILALKGAPLPTKDSSLTQRRTDRRRFMSSRRTDRAPGIAEHLRVLALFDRFAALIGDGDHDSVLRRAHVIISTKEPGDVLVRTRRMWCKRRSLREQRLRQRPTKSTQSALHRDVRLRAKRIYDALVLGDRGGADAVTPSAMMCTLVSNSRYKCAVKVNRQRRAQRTPTLSSPEITSRRLRAQRCTRWCE